MVTTDVGDRYVLEALRREGGLLGGEQSGHIIYLRDHVTGDGLAAALLLCGALGGRPSRRLRRSCRVTRRPRPMSASPVDELTPALVEEVKRLNQELEGQAVCWCGLPARSP